MKNIKFLIVLVACVSFHSCEDYLDKAPDNQMTELDVFTRYDKVDGMISDLYDKVKNSSKPLIYFNHFGTASITDEGSASNHEQSIPHQFHTGNWGPERMPANSDARQYWDRLYENVRIANLILDGIDRYNTPDNPRDGREGDIQKRIGETHFLKAYLYYILIKQYGEAPYVDHIIKPQDDMKFEKESVHTIVDRICAEADVAYGMVPDFQSTEFGRVDKGACLGLKAMARWLAATPMWNGGTLPNDTRVHKEEYSYNAARWTAAKEAAKAVMDFRRNDGSLRYKLYAPAAYDENDFTDVNGADASASQVHRRLWDMLLRMDSYKEEWIWFSTNDKDIGGWGGDRVPPSMGGHARERPVQEQVDEYEIIIDGYGYPIYSDKAKEINPLTGSPYYDDGNPYVNRDPRFYRDIVYHGATFSGRVINTFDGQDVVGADYQSSSSHTGYYLRKYFKEGWTKNSAGYSLHGPAHFRLPTIIYIYAEAVNNTDGPSQAIVNLLNEVRARSFMAPIPPAAASDKALLNEYIQRERRVELFFENDRVWRCRLYLEPDDSIEKAKDAKYGAFNHSSDTYIANGGQLPYPKTQHRVHGMKPVRDDNGKIQIGANKYRMERFEVEDRVFESPKHYFFPIMNSELKQTPGLVQNPGW
ncbi:carbohydrate-binding protein [Bacteroidia bacterium]|nr:carbohydrate-binding protein [Bacteroidia bacterium]